MGPIVNSRIKTLDAGVSLLHIEYEVRANEDN